jgi:hypothetical protein
MDAVNWEAVGALAELAGATAVVVTLIYLAIQIRHNSKLLGHQFLTSHHDALNEHFRDAYRIQGLSDLLVRSLAGAEGFTPEERAILHYRLVSYLNTMQVLFYRRKYGLLDPSLSHPIDRIAGLTGSAFGRRWWPEVGRHWDAFSDEFVRHVDSLLERTAHEAERQEAPARRVLEGFEG